MYLRKLSIEGYRNFSRLFNIKFTKGLNVLVGENGTGKSAIVDAVRAILIQDDIDRVSISENDFYRPFTKNKERAKSLRIKAIFKGLSKDEEVAFLPWTDLDGRATLTLFIENKQNTKGRYKRELWGGASRASMFERELFDYIDCIYLPPLRDAEAKLREGRFSILARLLKNLEREALNEANKKKEDHSLVKSVKNLNRELVEQSCIKEANRRIRERLRDALGTVFGQDSQIQFSETSFSRIVESLRLFFFPELNQNPSEEMWRSLEENSLGYNNLLYLATILAELTEVENSVNYRVILIEEPEAHLHPQLQIRLLKYLRNIENIQIIITTHSTVLASSAPLKSLIHLSKRTHDEGIYEYKVVPLKSCKLRRSSRKFIERWLDVTKSNLLFAKGVILVEGIAETMLLPVLAKIVLADYNAKKGNIKKKLPDTLEDAGISVINMNGIYFEHFMQLFCNIGGDDNAGKKIPIRCSGITDNDPKEDKMPTKHVNGNNPALRLIEDVNKSKYAKLYPNNLKTFEYDLAMENDNLNVMLKTISELWPKTTGSCREKIDSWIEINWAKENDKIKRAKVAYGLLTIIEKSKIGKGLFAQVLADKLQSLNGEFAVPKYIKKAIIWACGETPDDT